ncbi:hypothetical protein KY284_008745 [Solanum tuberosum]|nr:hypothetical protein KY284_008745 [Solanum tuberosum]
METKRALIVYEDNNEEVLPLAMQRDENEDRLDTNEANGDKNDLVQNIAAAIIEGDLSPK